MEQANSLDRYLSRTDVWAMAFGCMVGTVALTALCVPHVSWDVFRSFGSMGIGKGFAVFTIIILAPWVFVGFGYASASAAWKLAKLENERRIQITGAIGTLVTGAFAIVHLMPQLTAFEAMGGTSFLILSLWCLLGFIFYWRTVIHSTLTEYSQVYLGGWHDHGLPLGDQYPGPRLRLL